ncbi:anti-sigma factor RsbA family regulatory protein [Geodermatophilus sp. SYSU D01062]
MTSGTGVDLLHAALLYDSVDELRAAAAPFLADGLAAGDAVVLACGEERDALLARAAGGEDRVLRLPARDVWTGCARALAAWRRLVHRCTAAGAPRVRLVAAVPPDPQRWAEWHRYEAALNLALAPLPLTALCVYDRREVSDVVRDGVEETHPLRLTPGGLVPGNRHVEPATVLRRYAAGPAPAAPDGPPTLVLADLTDPGRLPELRAHVRAALDGADGQAQPYDRFAAAVTEVLGNAFRHGTPPVAVRVWTTPTRLECTVTDSGDGFDDPLAGFLPRDAGTSPAGAGLWMARQACDTVETSRTPTGFAVRLATSLPGPDAPPGSAPGAASPGTGTERTGADRAGADRADRARAEARELARRLAAQL